MIPEGWNYKLLEDLCDSSAAIRYGVVQIGSDTPGGVPIVPIKFIACIASSRLHRASRSIEGKYSGSRIAGGDILLSVKGTIGHVGVVPNGFHGNIAREIARIRPNKLVDCHFLLYQLQAPRTQKQIQQKTVGTTRLEFSIAAVRKFPILVPPLVEQKSIAEILSTWDRAIETTEKLIANSEAQKKALMQQLLTGKKRLPGFRGEWKEYTLGEIGSTFTGLSGKSAKDFGDGEFYIQYKNVFENEEVNFSALERVRIGTSENQYIVEHGDFIFTTSSETPDEVGVCSVVLEPSGSIYLNSFCFGYRPNSHRTILPHFGKFFFRSNLFRRRLHSLAQGSTRYNLSKSAFLDICVHLPGPDEQAAIANILRTSADAVTRRKADLRRFKLEKAALMQQLLTGKRRVKIKGEAQAA